jgi:hypothetical protein
VLCSADLLRSASQLFQIELAEKPILDPSDHRARIIPCRIFVSALDVASKDPSLISFRLEARDIQPFDKYSSLLQNNNLAFEEFREHRIDVMNRCVLSRRCKDYQSSTAGTSTIPDPSLVLKPSLRLHLYPEDLSSFYSISSPCTFLMSSRVVVVLPPSKLTHGPIITSNSYRYTQNVANLQREDTPIVACLDISDTK